MWPNVAAQPACGEMPHCEATRGAALGYVPACRPRPRTSDERTEQETAALNRRSGRGQAACPAPLRYCRRSARLPWGRRPSCARGVPGSFRRGLPRRPEPGRRRSRPHGPAGITKGSSLLHAWRAQACAVPSAAVLASWLQCTDWLPGISRTVSKAGTTMLHYAVVFFIIAVIAAALGFRGIAGMSADIGVGGRDARDRHSGRRPARWGDPGRPARAPPVGRKMHHP